MKKQFVYDPLISKRQQYLLATQVCLSFLFLLDSANEIPHPLQLVRAVLKIGIYLHVFFKYSELTLFHSL